MFFFLRIHAFNENRMEDNLIVAYQQRLRHAQIIRLMKHLYNNKPLRLGRVLRKRVGVETVSRELCFIRIRARSSKCTQ